MTTLKRAALVAAPLLALDILTKRLVEAFLVPGRPYEVLGEVARLRLVYNRGAAMGIPVGANGRWIMVAVSGLVLAALVVVLLRTRPELRRTVTALAVVIAGAVGNLIDRLFSGRGVVDFIDVGVGTLRFYTFNVADACVTTGVLLLLFFPDPKDRSPAA